MNGTLGDVFVLLAKFGDFTMSPFSLILLRHRPSLFKIKLSLFMLCRFWVCAHFDRYRISCVHSKLTFWQKTTDS